MGCCQVLQRPEFGGAGSWDRVGGVVVPGGGCVPVQPHLSGWLSALEVVNTALSSRNGFKSAQESRPSHLAPQPHRRADRHAPRDQESRLHDSNGPHPADSVRRLVSEGT